MSDKVRKAINQRIEKRTLARLPAEDKPSRKSKAAEPQPSSDDEVKADE